MTPVAEPEPFPQREKLEKLIDFDNGQVILFPEVLDRICEKAGNLPIAAISTIGTFRKGKTFWQNTLLNGLQKGEANFAPDDIVGGYENIPFKSDWRGHTKGLLVWPEVFFRTNANGEKVAVILIDVQGTFDPGCDQAESATLAIIASLLASTLVFNSANQVNYSELEALRIVFDYCNEYNLQQEGKEKLGENMILLVRDSIGDPGLNPGYLKVLKEQAARTATNTSLLDGIFNSFQTIDSFHIPRPPLAVHKADIQIRAGDCEKFLDVLCDGANHTIQKILPKRINGNPLNREQFKLYVLTLTEHFKTNQINVANLIQANDHYRLGKLMTEERNSFLIDFKKEFQELDLPMDPKEFALKMNPLIGNSVSCLTKRITGSDEEKRLKTDTYSKMLGELGNEKAEFNAVCFMRMKSMKTEDQTKFKKVTQAVLLGIGVGGLVVVGVGGVAAAVVYGGGATGVSVTLTSTVATVQKFMASQAGQFVVNELGPALMEFIKWFTEGVVVR